MANQDKEIQTKIVNVIPISKGILKDTLSYFTSKEVSVGDIVSVPLRKKLIDAIVLSFDDPAKAKAKLRSSGYSLKKIGENKGKHFFLPETLRAFEETADFYASSIGSVIDALTPKIIFSNFDDIKKIPLNKSGVKKGLAHETVVLQTSDGERVANYKNIIRGEFARGQSVFLCLPQVSDMEYFKKELEKGIEDYTFVLHSKVAKNKLISAWNEIVTSEHPVLIIATGTFLNIPRGDLKTIILDKEGSGAYKMLSRPFIDMRVFAEILAKHKKARLILGDVFLRPETIWRQKEGELPELNPLQFRSISTADQSIVDMRQYKKHDKKEKNNFVLIGNELSDLIEENIRWGENLFILVSRKGLYTTTICNDCGNTALCPDCNTPLILHKKEHQNIFTCHKCGYDTDKTDKCQTCHSWRLVPLGIGIERAEEEIKTKFKGVNIWRIDKDSTTESKAKEISKKFSETPGSVLLGTEMALSYLDYLPNIENTAILSLDSLFAIPDFRINEKIFRILLRTRNKATKRFLIQTRQFEEKIFQLASGGNILNFYKEEISQRKALGYPPFNLFIKISYSADKAKVISEIEKLEKILEKFKPISFQAFSPLLKGKYTMHLVIKKSPKDWPDPELVNILHSLPPSFTINIEPESLL